MSVEELKRIMEPPRNPVGINDDASWIAIERDVGVSLPADYKDLVLQYGVGCIGGFLWVLNPFTKNTNLNLAFQVQVKLDAMKQLRDEFGTKVPSLFPEEMGLFPWAFTDNGDVLYLRFQNGTLPPPVVIGDSGGIDWAEFDGTVSDSLAALLTRRFVVSFFPDDFPSDAPTFVPTDGIGGGGSFPEK